MTIIILISLLAISIQFKFIIKFLLSYVIVSLRYFEFNFDSTMVLTY